MKCVLVEWVDATSFDPWHPLDEAEATSLHTIFSCGFLKYEDTHRTVLMLSYDSEGEAASQVLAIPSSCIVNMHELRGAIALKPLA